MTQLTARPLSPNRLSPKQLLHRLSLALLWVQLGLLSSCVSYSKQQVDQSITQYKGLNLPQLIAVWGVPSKQFEANGQYYIEWISEERSGSSAVSIGTGSGGRNSFFGLGITLPIEQQNDVCIRRATTDSKQQKIIDLKWQGDSDFCGELLYQLKNNK